MKFTIFTTPSTLGELEPGELFHQRITLTQEDLERHLSNSENAALIIQMRTNNPAPAFARNAPVLKLTVVKVEEGK